MKVLHTVAVLSLLKWASCKECRDQDPNCAISKYNCGKYKAMESTCPKTCGFCQEGPKCPRTRCSANCTTEIDHHTGCPTCRCNPSDVCQLPSETGRCYAHMPRYFFNTKTQRCEKFVYGGCGGNENNFDTLNDCKKRCDKKDVCQLPSETGPCRAYFERYFFNTKSQRCEKFVYGGCGGNENNFETLNDCKKRCDKKDDCLSLSPPGSGFWIPGGFPGAPSCREKHGVPTGISRPGGQCCTKEAAPCANHLESCGTGCTCRTVCVQGENDVGFCNIPDTQDAVVQCRKCSSIKDECLSLSPPGVWIPGGFPGAPTCYEKHGVPTGISRPGGQCCTKDCPMISPLILAPVCGSDGKTYDNRWDLESENCVKGVNVIVKYEGRCKTVDPEKDLMSFEEFLLKYNKQYPDEAEYLKRKAIFEKTVRKIREHNRKYYLGEVTYEMGINQFSDMELN